VGQWSPVGVEDLWAAAIFRTLHAMRTCRFKRENHKLIAVFVRIQNIIYDVYNNNANNDTKARVIGIMHMSK